MNTEAKHTPGPWHIIERTGHVSKSHEQTFDIMSGPNGSPHEWDMVCDKAAGANARLIAAAPELLEACKAVSEAHAYIQRTGSGETRALCEAVDLLRAAVAKAEGRE